MLTLSRKWCDVMLKLWPIRKSADRHDDTVSHEDACRQLTNCAALSLQAIHVTPQPGGWLITVNSPVETGTVELFVPQDRETPVRIAADSRANSTPLSFESVFAAGHFPEAVVVAEWNLGAARMAIPSELNQAGALARSAEGQALVRALQNVGQASLRSGRYEQAEAALAEAIQICDTAPELYGPILARLLHDRAHSRFLNRCSNEEAMVDVQRELAQARRRAEQMLGQSHPEIARIMTTQARLLVSEFAYAEAEELLDAAIRIRSEALGKDHADTSDSLLEQARLNAYLENNEEADEQFRKVIAVREAACGPNHPDVADALFQYTDFLTYNLRDPAQAGPLLRRALSIWEETIGLEHEQIARESEFISKVLSNRDESSMQLQD